jgi:predicted secreted Zn-dependent protease
MLAMDAGIPDDPAMRHAFAALLLAAVLLPATLGAQPVAPEQASPAPLAVAQIPGVTVNYYDVSGATPGKILASARNQRPKDANGKVQPSSARWSIEADIQKATTGSQCRVVRAAVAFKAEVLLPRLVITPRAKGEEEEEGEEKLQAFAKRWQAHLAKLDQQQLAYLQPIYERLPQVERAIMASSCEGARAAGERAIAEIRRQAPPPAP